MALNGFAPSAYGSVSAGQTASAVEIPGSGAATLVITNTGGPPAAVLLAASQEAAEAVAQNNGIVVMPGPVPLVLTIGSNTWVGVVALGFGNSQLNLAVGT